MPIQAVLIPALAPMESIEISDDFNTRDFERIAGLLSKSRVETPVVGAKCRGMNVAAGVFFNTFYIWNFDFQTNGGSAEFGYNERASRLAGFRVNGPALIARVDGEKVSGVKTGEIVAVLSITG